MAMAVYANPSNDAGATGVANTVRPFPLVGTVSATMLLPAFSWSSCWPRLSVPRSPPGVTYSPLLLRK